MRCEPPDRASSRRCAVLCCAARCASARSAPECAAEKRRGERQEAHGNADAYGAAETHSSSSKHMQCSAHCFLSLLPSPKANGALAGADARLCIPPPSAASAFAHPCFVCPPGLPLVCPSFRSDRLRERGQGGKGKGNGKAAHSPLPLRPREPPSRGRPTTPRRPHNHHTGPSQTNG